ncbi:hypothetical protein ES705_38229 [subsurface metagenome]
MFRGKCVKYVISSDTWTQYTNYLFILGHHATVGPTWYGRASCAAIKADGSVVYLGATGGAEETANYWTYGKYTVATDTYAARSALTTLSDEFIYAYDKDKLWYYEAGGTCQQGYVDTADDSENDDQFTENTDRDAGYGLYCGIKDDLSRIIAHARAAAPELISETTLVAPTVATDPATDITHAATTLNGELTNDGGEACNCGFEWGETVLYGNTTPIQSRTTGQTFSQGIAGLDPNKTYHFRAFATNGAGTSYGADRTFTTLVAAPTVTTNPATGLGMILATLNGTLVDDGGEPCQCGFEWGTDVGYGLTTPTETKTIGQTFSQVIRGLFPGTTYYFKAFATNSKGTVYGAGMSFGSKPSFSRAYALAREEL